MKSFRIVFAVCLMLLIASDAAAVTPAVFDIPYLSHAPKIDGVIEEEEWRHAVAITGGVSSGVLTQRQCIYWFGWDEDHLYLAARSFSKPGSGRPLFLEDLEDLTDKDAPPRRPDDIELRLFPLQSRRLDRPYTLLLSGDHVGTSDVVALTPGGEHISATPVYAAARPAGWKDDVLTASRAIPDPEATLGEGTMMWEIEARLPRSTFDIDQDNAAGDEWRMLLSRNFNEPRQQSHLPVSHGFFNARGYARGRLTRRRPTVQLRDVSPLQRGKAGVGLHFSNPTETAQRFVKDITIRKAETGEIVHGAQREFEVAPGEVLRHVPDTRIEGLSEGRRARVELSVLLTGHRNLITYSADYIIE